MVHSTASIEGKSASHELMILLVESDEDEAFVEDLVGMHKGYKVLSASDMSSALGAAGSAKVDVLISELNLRDGDGRTLLQSLKRGHGHLFSISVGGLEDAQKSADAGFNAHLEKPVDAREVARLIGWIS